MKRRKCNTMLVIQVDHKTWEYRTRNIRRGELEPRGYTQQHLAAAACFVLDIGRMYSRI